MSCSHGRRPVNLDTRYMRGGVSDRGLNAQFVPVYRAEPDELYRTAICDSGNNRVAVWRMTYVVDTVPAVIEATSSPGKPAFFSVPPYGAQFDVRLSTDKVTGTRTDPWSLAVTEANNGDVSVTVVESDGLLEFAMPPELVYSAVGVTVNATGTLQLPVPSGLYTVSRGAVTKVGGAGDFSAITLEDVTGVTYAGTTSLDIPFGSPLYVEEASGGGLTLDWTVSAGLTANIVLALRRDDRDFLLSPISGPLG